VSDYQIAIHEVYIYNNNTINEIKNTKNKFGLLPYEYDSIYIRRGDKLLNESTIINEEDYLNLLLFIHPECKKLFVQTDDYTSVINLQNLIDKNEYQIKLLTLCDKNNNGSFANNYYTEKLEKHEIDIKDNIEYLRTIKKPKLIQEMNKNEIKEHTLELIIGLDIIRNSNICVTDYQSNVGRFIKLSNYNPNNVYDVISKTNNLDYKKKVCPAYSF
jgi:hypothetical protein